MSSNFKHRLESNSCDEREPGSVIDTVVVHSMYVPDSKECFSALECKAVLDQYDVSAHYFIDRSGDVWPSVPEELRAWHAGESKMPADGDGRTGVNMFSIGIELIGSEDSGFTAEQYVALSSLTEDICTRHPVKYIVGHSHIAPERKSDPWNFDWERFRGLLSLKGVELPST